MLAFPALGLVPSGTPMKNMPNSPPPGVGPYKITNIVPNAVVHDGQEPEVARRRSPASPSGHVNVNVKISSNVDSNALSVLNNTADVFDWADTIPGSLLPQINVQGVGPVLEEDQLELDVLHLPEHQGQAVHRASWRERP